MNSITISSKDFSLKHTFDCGQCFRWQRQSDGSYIGVAGGRVIRMIEKENTIEMQNCSKEDFDTFFKKYFDLQRDYSKIKEIVSINPTMQEAISYGWGIRILRQEFFETLISFIISQRNSIPKIQTLVNRLCEKFGDEIEFDKKIYYSFPSAERLAEASLDEIASLGVGYRAKYILKASQMVASGEINEKDLEENDTEYARKKLLSIFGVGDKVCDCVLLFSLGKYDLFPADVWIKRVMQESFDSSFAKETGEKMFGKYSGFAQQYLFYWRREGIS